MARQEKEIKDFVGQKIKDARQHANLSQARLATLLGLSQAHVSDIERGEITVSSLQLVQLGDIFKKPISYFFPSNLEQDVTELESRLLDLFRQFPERWQQRVLHLVNMQWTLYQRIKPYEQAGIPEEFYGALLWEKEETLEMEEVSQRDENEDQDFNEFYKRFRGWLAETERKIKPS